MKSFFRNMGFFCLLVLGPKGASAQTWNNLLNSINHSTGNAPSGCTNGVVTPDSGSSSVRANISSADLCTNPATAICSQFANATTDRALASARAEVSTQTDGTDALDTQFEKVTAARNALGLSVSNEARRPSLNALLVEQQKQLKMVASIERNSLSQFHLTTTDLSDFFEQIRKSLIAHVASSPEFEREQNAQHIGPNREDIIAKLKSVKLETTQSLFETPAPTNDTELAGAVYKRISYAQNCGPDGMQVNAFYDGNSNTLKICPGFLVETLHDAGGRIASLAMVLGHELGHSVDSGAYIPFANFGHLTHQFPQASFYRSLHDCYSKFFDCVNQNYITSNVEHFGTYTGIINQLENKGIPGLEAEIARLEAIDPPDLSLISRLKISVMTGNHTLAQYKDTRDSIISSHQNPNDILSAQQQELVADYHSAFALTDQLKRVPQSERALVAAQSYRLFCGSPLSDYIRKIKYGTENDAEHPPEKFRMEMIFRNPDVRNLLGCVPLSTARPWCDLGSSSHPH
jgi:hypothetical protein